MTTAQLDRPVVNAPAHRDYLSFSSLSLYRSCPLRYFFKYHLGLPEEGVSSSLVLGSAVHRAIESDCFYPAPSAMSCPSCPYRAQCRGWNG